MKKKRKGNNTGTYFSEFVAAIHNNSAFRPCPYKMLLLAQRRSFFGIFFPKFKITKFCWYFICYFLVSKKLCVFGFPILPGLTGKRYSKVKSYSETQVSGFNVCFR